MKQRKTKNRAIGVVEQPVESGAVETETKRFPRNVELLKEWWNGDKMFKVGDVVSVNEITFERLTKTNHAKEI